MKPLIRALAIVSALVVCSASLASQARVDVTGKWKFTVETSAGGGTPIITLRQDGEKLTGHYSGQLGESDLTGSVKGQALTFQFSAEVQGTSLLCIYTGSVEDRDSLKGTVKITPLGDGTFTAKRE